MALKPVTFKIDGAELLKIGKESRSLKVPRSAYLRDIVLARHKPPRTPQRSD